MPSHGPEGDPHGILTNPWEYLVRDDQDITFQTLRPRSGPQSFQDYWRRNQSRVLQDFDAETGARALRGEAPTLDLFDFVQRYPFQARYQNLSPRGRGDFGAFGPRLSFDSYRR